jgi:hypothetical protein
MRIKFESMPKRTNLKPDFRLWLEKLDRLNTEPFMERGREQPPLSAAAKCFAIHLFDTRQDDMTNAPLMVPKCILYSLYLIN